MATCDIQALLDDAACFNALPPGLLRAATAQLWCNVAEGIANLDNPNPSIQSLTDGLWYRTGGVDVGGGEALFWMTQIVTAAGPNAYLVIADPISGLKYKLQATGSPPDVVYELDDTPTGEAETPTQIVVLGTTYDLIITDDGGLFPALDPV